jgi:hypothetical protein
MKCGRHECAHSKHTMVLNFCSPILKEKNYWAITLEEKYFELG